MSRMPLRVLLVDDHEVVRSGIAAMLKATEGIVVTGEAGTVREAIEEAERTRPDIVVMDVRLADGSGIEATRKSRAANSFGPSEPLGRARACWTPPSPRASWIDSGKASTCSGMRSWHAYHHRRSGSSGSWQTARRTGRSEALWISPRRP